MPANVLPAQRRGVGEQRVRYRVALGAQVRDGGADSPAEGNQAANVWSRQSRPAWSTLPAGSLITKTDLNPIGQAFAKLKALLRKAAERTKDGL